MSDRPSTWSAFRDLDASEDIETAVKWLGQVAEIPPVREGKRRSYELLDVGPGDRVLDVGCGRGDDVLALSQLIAPGGRAIGIDSSAGAVDAARRIALAAGVEARFEVGDAVGLSFPNDSFDACRCDRTLQHIFDSHSALREIVRVVRPGGVVLVSEGWNSVVADPDLDVAALLELLLLHQSMDERPGWLGFMLPLLLSQVGLASVRLERITGNLAEAATIAAFYDLPRLAKTAFTDGRLAEKDLESLWELLERETAAGRLSVAVDTYLFVGQVPG
jgi:SAM-dependent methyltransferase